LLSTAHARLVTPAAVLLTTAVVVAATVVPAFAAQPLTSGTTIPGTPGPGVTLADGSALASAPVRVMVIGDSVAQSLDAGLVHAQSRYHLKLANMAILGCGVAQGTGVWVQSHGVETQFIVAAPCQLEPHHGFVTWETAWKSWLRAVKPNVVVLLAGRWEMSDRTYQGHRTNILNPVLATYVRHQLERAVTIATSTGARLVLETAPCFDAGQQPNGAPFPEDDPRRLAIYNGIVRAVAREFPKTVTLQNLFALACPEGKFVATLHGAPFRPDGIHFAPDPGTGADLLAPRILPLWEQLGHIQEEAGGEVIPGPVPKQKQLSPP